MQTAVTPKDRLFHTAARLFFQQGYRAVGVDTIAAESGISKMTLYRHYPSKDDLIVAYLRHSHDSFWSHFEENTKDACTAREKLYAFFQALQQYVTTPTCYGCPFINIAAEYPAMDYPGHQIALEHKLGVRARFYRLAKEAGAHDPKTLASALLLLMDGAYMAARMFSSSSHNPAAHVAEFARQLIDAHCES